jgi:hypothetical protein
MDNFSVHYQTWKNKKAVRHTITEFRKFFPNNKIRLVSDNGADYSEFVEEFDLLYKFENTNVFPGGRFKELWQCYEWLRRVNDTCQEVNSEWIVLFEDDVITQNSKINFPTCDSGGFIVHPWNSSLTQLLKTKNVNNENWGYGMAGGSIFKRTAFIDSYSKIDEFKLEELAKYDNRIVGWSDTLINCFLQYFGYTYEVWKGMDDMSYPAHIVSPDACFVHGYKEFYNV